MDDLIPTFRLEGDVFVGNDFIPIRFLEENGVIGIIL